MVPGFNKEVKFYKRVTHDDGATETEPTTLDEIMQMEITMVLPPPASVEAGERAEPQARGRVCGGGCRQAAAHLIHTTHTSHTYTFTLEGVYCKHYVPVVLLITSFQQRPQRCLTIGRRFRTSRSRLSRHRNPRHKTAPRSLALYDCRSHAAYESRCREMRIPVSG